jgi:RHS repeat-associated protein
VATTTQCNPGVTGCKAFTAAYDKLGNLTSLVYPANSFTVTYGIDSAARLTSATDSNGVIYAQAPTYWANGAMKEFSSPNFNNNTYHVDLNNRLQPTEIWAGSAEGASALFDKKYIYGAATANNGNISTITNVLDSTRTQSFGYDALNRLLSAGDNGHWANTYVYDAWGNLTNKNVSGPTGENLQKAADANNHLSGMSYDAGGNVTNDGLGHTFVFDAENRIITGAGVTNTYDADGRRIAKSTGINYWYAPGGAALAETDSSGNSTNYIFFASQRLARNVNGDIKYYITDHLHSTGMFVDKAGTVAAIQDDNDFYPWGGVVPGIGNTTSNNTIKFTGKYRDAESQLDYFGARYYSNINGRFMSPDWAVKPASVPFAKFDDPQSLNLYAYVENGPVNRADADGHMVVGFTGSGVFGVRGTGVNDGGASLSSSGAAKVLRDGGDIKGNIEVTYKSGGDPHNHSGGDPHTRDSGFDFKRTQYISIRNNGPKWDPLGIFKKDTLKSNLENDRAVLNAAASIALDPMSNGSKPAFGFMLQIMDLEDKNIIVDMIALGYEIGDTKKIAAFPGLEKYALKDTVEALQMFRDQNNAQIDTLLKQAAEAARPKTAFW